MHVTVHTTAENDTQPEHRAQSSKQSTFIYGHSYVHLPNAIGVPPTQCTHIMYTNSSLIHLQTTVVQHARPSTAALTHWTTCNHKHRGMRRTKDLQNTAHRLLPSFCTANRQGSSVWPTCTYKMQASRGNSTLLLMQPQRHMR